MSYLFQFVPSWKDVYVESDLAVPGVFSLERLVIGPVVFALHPLIDKHLLQLHLRSPEPSRQPQHRRRLPHPRLQVWDEMGRLAKGGGGHLNLCRKETETGGDKVKKSRGKAGEGSVVSVSEN